MIVRRWRSGGRRGVATIIAAVLMTALTVAAGAMLWLYRPPFPTTPVAVQYFAQGDQREPAWSDPTDCANWSVPLNAQCDWLPAIFIIFTSHSPDSLPLADLRFNFYCNGTLLLNGTFKALEIIPGTGTNPGAGAPKIGNCGTWAWGTGQGTTGSYFNRLAYFQQVQAGYPTLKNGDLFVVYIHPLAGFCDRFGYGCPPPGGHGGSEDDYHGAPLWCFTVPGACSIQLTYTGQPQTIIATIPLTQLQG
jgi:hypothetical protein